MCDTNETGEIADLLDPVRENDDDSGTSIVETLTGDGETVLEAERSTGKTKGGQYCK
jgi:hypothetical protein